MHSKSIFYFLFGTILFFISISVHSQTIEKDRESYVRPKESSNGKPTLKLLHKEKRKAEKVTRDLKGKLKGPNTSLSALEQDIVNKTDQRIDSLAKVINEQKGIKKIKGSEKVVGKGKTAKNEQLQRAEKEVASNLRVLKREKNFTRNCKKQIST
jgi:hypothetical protein